MIEVTLEIRVRVRNPGRDLLGVKEQIAHAVEHLGDARVVKIEQLRERDGYEQMKL